MTDLAERCTEYLSSGGLFNPEMMEHDKVRDLIIDCRNEIERLRKYRSVVHFIANDYYELSYDKIKWQRDDWRKRCQKVIEEDSADD